MKLRVLKANGLRFTAYVRGDGPVLLLMLHGFPDDAAGMIPLMEALDPDRFTMVAPFMRGYGPSAPAPDGRYQLHDLAGDVLGLLDALGAQPWQARAVFGHDWGALATYAACARDPDAITHAITASVPPPATVLGNILRHPRQLLRSSYILGLQLPVIGPTLLARDNHLLVEQLWRRWSPTWRFRPSRLAKVKNTLGRPATMRAAPAYYRGLLVDAILDHARWRKSLELARRPISTPTMVLFGERDQCVLPEMYEDLDGAFTIPVTSHHLPECGHFVQQEATAAVRDLITEFVWGA